MSAAASITSLLHRAGEGDAEALRQVFDSTYQELRSLARMRLATSRRGPLLDTTSLVHESFLRFASANQLQLSDRQHFLRYAATVMRSVIVDLVRQQTADRRGGQALHVTLSTHGDENITNGEEEILRVHDALEELARFNPRLVQVVEMRYFAGMTESEMAQALGVTDRTIRRDWEKARVLLAQSLLDAL
jgi:RNA polymerase sigma factor (TIGR02999 family)